MLEHRPGIPREDRADARDTQRREGFGRVRELHPDGPAALAQGRAELELDDPDASRCGPCGGHVDHHEVAAERALVGAVEPALGVPREEFPGEAPLVGLEGVGVVRDGAVGARGVGHAVDGSAKAVLTRDEVSRAINSEVKAGRGTPHGGVYLDIASRMSPEEIKRRLPSMYHQFLELAEVDITKDEMVTVRHKKFPAQSQKELNSF